MSVTALRWPGAARGEIAAEDYAHAGRLPDGTLLLVDQQQGVNRVYALHPNGMSVELTATSLLPPKGKTTPPLSVEQLKAIALDRTWSR